MSQKVGALIFFLLLLVIVFGLLSFTSEFFLGKPLIKTIRELLFFFDRKT